MIAGAKEAIDKQNRDVWEREEKALLRRTGEEQA